MWSVWSVPSVRFDVSCDTVIQTMNNTSRLVTACPFCHVAPGEPCMGANGRPRLSVHAERWGRKLAAARKRKAKIVKEGDIRAALKARVESYGGEIRAVSWLGRHSAPDVLALLPFTIDWQHTFSGGMKFKPRLGQGSHTFVETKRPGKDATAAQAREHERMRASGCVVVMVRNMAELDAWLPVL